MGTDSQKLKTGQIDENTPFAVSIAGLAIIAGVALTVLSGCVEAPMGSLFTTGAMASGTMLSGSSATATSSNATTEQPATTNSQQARS